MAILQFKFAREKIQIGANFPRVFPAEGASIILSLVFNFKGRTRSSRGPSISFPDEFSSGFVCIGEMVK